MTLSDDEVLDAISCFLDDPRTSVSDNPLPLTIEGFEEYLSDPDTWDLSQGEVEDAVLRAYDWGLLEA